MPPKIPGYQIPGLPPAGQAVIFRNWKAIESLPVGKWVVGTANLSATATPTLVPGMTITLFVPGGSVFVEVTLSVLFIVDTTNITLVTELRTTDLTTAVTTVTNPACAYFENGATQQIPAAMTWLFGPGTGGPILRPLRSHRFDIFGYQNGGPGVGRIGGVFSTLTVKLL